MVIRKSFPTATPIAPKRIFKKKKGEKREYLPSQELTCGDCSEPFLTSGIPDLKLNPFAIKLNGPYLEVNAVSG